MRDRSGFAVVAVLILALALAGLAHGAFVLAEAEAGASGVERNLTGRRFAARAALAEAFVDDTLPTLGDAPVVLRTGAAAPLHWRAEATALGPEWVLLGGFAAVDPLPGEAGEGAVAWRLDPPSRVAAARGVVESGGGVRIEDGSLTADGFLDDLPDVPGCAAERAGLAAARAAPRPQAPLTDSVAAPVPPLGLLAGARLLALAEPAVPCPDRDPLSPATACDWPLARVDGDLNLSGRWVRGVVVVTRSVRLDDAARVDGVVIAGGDVTLDGGARIRGMVRAGGRVTLRGGGAILGAGCAAAAAFRAARTLRVPRAISAGRIRMP